MTFHDCDITKSIEQYQEDAEKYGKEMALVKHGFTLEKVITENYHGTIKKMEPDETKPPYTKVTFDATSCNSSVRKEISYSFNLFGPKDASDQEDLDNAFTFICCALGIDPGPEEACVCFSENELIGKQVLLQLIDLPVFMGINIMVPTSGLYFPKT